MKGLADEPRGGRPATYSPEQVGNIIADALTDPQQLNQPFGSSTLDRLVVYLVVRLPPDISRVMMR